MFDKFGHVKDINEAVFLAQEALELHSVGDLSPLCTLATFVSVRFREAGDLADLDQVITLRRDILECSHTVSSLHELALSVSERFDQLGASADIDEAIQLELLALRLLSPGQLEWVLSLRRITLYRQKKSMDRTGLESVRKQVMGAVYNALELLPPRLLSTHTGIIHDRDALVSAFENSQQYKQLLSPTTVNSMDSICDTVFAYTTRKSRCPLVKRRGPYIGYG